MRDDEWGERWFQATWHRLDAENLIVLQEGGNVLFDTSWPVWELVRSLHLKRQGVTHAPPGMRPYRLVELRSDDPGVKRTFRGRWTLGMQFRNPNKPDAVLLATIQWTEEPIDDSDLTSN